MYVLGCNILRHTHCHKSYVHKYHGARSSATLTVKKVPDLVHVDLEVGDFNVKLQRLLHVVDMVKDVLHDARDDACNVHAKYIAT